MKQYHTGNLKDMTGSYIIPIILIDNDGGTLSNFLEDIKLFYWYKTGIDNKLPFSLFFTSHSPLRGSIDDEALSKFAFLDNNIKNINIHIIKMGNSPELYITDIIEICTIYSNTFEIDNVMASIVSIFKRYYYNPLIKIIRWEGYSMNCNTLRLY